MRNAMIVIFLGAPGTGKGTQAVRLAEMQSMLHISTGDLLRKEMAAGSSLGLQVKDIVTNGGLVSDDLINKIMQNGITPKVSYILDGYPRTVPQAEFLDTYLATIGEKVAHVIFFTVAEDIIMKRLTGRQKCSQCGKDFNSYFHPSTKGNVCDVCGAPLSQRADDREDVIKNRLITYERDTAPLLAYYTGKGLVRNVDGALPIDILLAQLNAIVKGG